MYNVEKYIRRCLLSIQKQTFTDFEVLVINDESPDNSDKIAEEFQNNDKRFTLYNKKNGGLGDARNYGLERAKGEYIVFIDSDDYISKKYLEVLYNECTQNNAEISYCRFQYSYFNKRIHIPMPIAPKKAVMSRDKALDMLIRDVIMHNYAWNKMYLRSLFTENDISYPSMFFEDIATSGRLMFHSEKVAVSNKYLYYYVKRGGSIMATMNARKINDLDLSILIIRNYIQYHGQYEQYKKALTALAKKIYIANIYSVLRMHILNNDFGNMKRNFQINNELYHYLTSEDYEAFDGMPELPTKFIQPGRRNRP